MFIIELFIPSVPSAVLNLSEGTVSETSITVSWSRNPQSLQDKFQVSTHRKDTAQGKQGIWRIWILYSFFQTDKNTEFAKN